ncbi:MAG TPA: hypothetical protein VK178_12935 [Opitutaceae bacterium]|nr:hypothetical protein [Opitutaceae bacterium]
MNTNTPPSNSPQNPQKPSTPAPSGAERRASSSLGSAPASGPSMWSSFLVQIPAILITAAVTIGVLVWLGNRVVENMTRQNERQMAELRATTEQRIKESNDALKSQMEATYSLLKDSVENHKGGLFMTDDELAKLNDEKVAVLAKALADQIQPYGMPIPKNPQEAEEQRNKQVDEVAGRMAGKIQPILEQMSKETTLTKDTVAGYSQRISDQIAVVLTSELAQKQKLNNNLLESNSIAQESMRISQQITALYLSQMKSESLLGRILMLPAHVVQDVGKGSIVNSNEREKVEARIAEDMKRLQQRLDNVKAAMPAPETSTSTAPAGGS